MDSQHRRSKSSIWRWASQFGLVSVEEQVMEIKIDNHFESKAYRPGEPISGLATIRCEHDTPFGHVEVHLNGVSYILTDCLQPDSVQVSHLFLHLKMPIDASFLPESKIFQARTTYLIPFTFVIPHQLPIGACTYKCSSETLRDQHLRPPPTMGSWNANDLAPGSARIKYYIGGRVFRSKSRELLMETSVEIGVLPAFPEEAPLDITADDTRYRLSQTKEIRKRIISGKTGYLRATATQPRAIVLTPDALESSASLLSVNLEFIPTSGDSTPPQLTYLSANIQSYTYYSVNHIRTMPNLGCPDLQQPIPIRLYCASENMSPRSPKNIKWEEASHSRKSSITFMSSDIEYAKPNQADEDDWWAEAKENSPFSCYTSKYDICLTLPLSKKTLFIPSFHSCLASRVYIVNVTLTLGPQNTCISLAVPLQITLKGSTNGDFNQLPQYSYIDNELDQDLVTSGLPAYDFIMSSGTVGS